MKTRLLKLASGEMVVTRVVDSEDEDVIKMESPFLLNLMPGPDQSMGVALMPFMPFTADTVFDLPRRFVMLDLDPPEEMENTYLQQISGLDLTTKMPLDDMSKIN